MLNRRAEGTIAMEAISRQLVKTADGKDLVHAVMSCRVCELVRDSCIACSFRSLVISITDVNPVNSLSVM
jgi:hypothetical protein